MGKKKNNKKKKEGQGEGGSVGVLKIKTK